MRGWVYIIVNKSMPGLVKVGYTDRSPDARAAELAGTGMPTPYTVAYSVQLPAARSVEERVHRELAKVRAGKEWFRCPVSVARAAIEKLAPPAPQGSESPLLPGHALYDYFD